jgi:SAM-dependent methyltransferase
MSTTATTTSDDALRANVARTNEWYERREHDSYMLNMWQPFQVDEVNGRCQQYREMARALRERGILSLRGRRVLDVGCGIGRHVRIYLDYGAEPDNVCGIEIRRSAVDQARQLAPNLRFELFDGLHIPFDDGSFDLVTQYVCFSSVLSRELRVHLAADMWRVVRPGGYIFWWDTLATQGPSAQERGHAINLDELFPGLARADALVSLVPGPDECVRPIRGGRFLRPLLRWLRPRPGHCASLIGPK